MGPSVEVLLDQKRYLRFGYRNSRLAVSVLQNAMPARAEKLSLGEASLLVLKPDQDAVLVFLHRGLNHEERETIKMDQVERWLEHALDAGRDLSEFSIPILEAMKQAHLITLNYKTTIQDDESGTTDDNGKPQLGGFVDPLTNRGPSGPLVSVGHDQTSRESSQS